MTALHVSAVHRAHTRAGPDDFADGLIAPGDFQTGLFKRTKSRSVSVRPQILKNLLKFHTNSDSEIRKKAVDNYGQAAYREQRVVTKR